MQPIIILFCISYVWIPKEITYLDYVILYTLIKVYEKEHF